MGIQKKIEEIRQKPEHQRVRYVWAMVAVCMLLLVALWVFSLRDVLNGGLTKNSQTVSNGDPAGSLGITSGNKEKLNESGNNH